MSSGIDKLKDIGAQKIHEQTHVPKGHIQAILHNSFEDLNKVQIIGFISILEREYKVDLNDTKDSANTYFNQLSSDSEVENKEIFVAVREKKSNNNILYIGIILLVLGVALYFTLKQSNTENAKIDNTLIENVKEKVVKDEKSTKTSIILPQKAKTKEVIEELNITKTKVEKTDKETIIKEEKKVLKSLEIIPKTKVWMGYIDIANNKHNQKVFKTPLEINGSKDWLLIFGHNQIDFKVDGKVKNIEKGIRFSYIDGELKPITIKEFKKLNKGSKW